MAFLRVHRDICGKKIKIKINHGLHGEHGENTELSQMSDIIDRIYDIDMKIHRI